MAVKKLVKDLKTKSAKTQKSKRYSRKIKFIVEKTDTGFSAFAEEMPVFTTGDNFTEMQQNAVEACTLYFEEENINITAANIDLQIDVQQFFQYYRVINAKLLAKRIGMNESLLSQYVQGKKNPSQKQVNRILDGIHEVGKELMEIKLFKR